MVETLASPREQQQPRHSRSPAAGHDRAPASFAPVSGAAVLAPQVLQVLRAVYRDDPER